MTSYYFAIVICPLRNAIRRLF